jgi:hypothetical protein
MHTNLILNGNRSRTVARRLIVNVVAWLITAKAQPTLAQTQQKTFASAEQASQQLYEAVRSKDDQAVQAILGAAPELTSTGNDEEDKLERERFAQKYQEMHRLVREADGSMVLYVGAENWPFPIPLVATNGKWHLIRTPVLRKSGPVKLERMKPLPSKCARRSPKGMARMQRTPVWTTLSLDLPASFLSPKMPIPPPANPSTGTTSESQNKRLVTRW